MPTQSLTPELVYTNLPVPKEGSTQAPDCDHRQVLKHHISRQVSPNRRIGFILLNLFY